MPEFVVLGNPANRRVRFFQEALRSVQQPPAQVLPWTVLAEGLELPDDAYLRIDSPEGDFEAYRLALQWGASEMDAERGEKLCLEGVQQLRPDGSGLRYARQRYLGFCRMLQQIQRDSAGHRRSHHPQEIAAMSDKQACHRRFVEAGLPTPEALQVESVEELHQQMRQQQLSRVFIKARHGSSAAGICAYHWDGTRRRLLTSMGRSRRGMYSSLRLREYSHPEDCAAFLGWVFDEGAHVERWMPKLQLEGREFDLRIVTLAGEPHHFVPRVSRDENPMTNLHFNNDRGDPQQALDQIGRSAWEQSLDLCRRTAALFPGSLCLGIDVMLVPQMGPMVIEVNAFGDLLPGILDARGLNTYEAQVHAILAQAIPTGAAP